MVYCRHKEPLDVLVYLVLHDMVIYVIPEVHLVPSIFPKCLFTKAFRLSLDLW